MEPTTSNTVDTKCLYCNENCVEGAVVFQKDNAFCCFGCATLFDLQENIQDYQWSDKEVSIEYKQYDLPELFHALVDFHNEKVYKFTINAPSIY